MTMEAIADEAQITKPTLYAYFSNKEDLAVEAFVEALEARTACLEELSESLPAEARLARVLRIVLEEKVDPERGPLILPGPTIAAHPRFQHALQSLVRRFARLFREAQTSGEANPQLDPEVTARAYLVFLTSPLDTDRTSVETLHTILVNGLRPV